MTIEQALNLLDQLTSQMSLPRATHAQVMEALKILQQACKKEVVETK